MDGRAGRPERREKRSLEDGWKERSGKFMLDKTFTERHRKIEKAEDDLCWDAISFIEKSIGDSVLTPKDFYPISFYDEDGDRTEAMEIEKIEMPLVYCLRYREKEVISEYVSRLPQECIISLADDIAKFKESQP
jgi:hypothetical protein